MKIRKDEEQTKDIIKSAVNKLADFVIPTYGPNNNGVLMNYYGMPQSLDDGVSIADQFEISENPAEQLVIEYIKETSKATSRVAKDATTTSILLLQGLIASPFLESVEEIKKGAKEAIAVLRARSKEINTEEELVKVTRIAYNHPMADYIASLAAALGADGFITVEESNGFESEFIAISGMQFDKGYISPHMVTDQAKEETNLDDVFVFVTDKKITAGKDINHLLKLAKINGSERLLIIADEVDGDALTTLVANKLRGLAMAVAVTAPFRGDQKTEFFHDICAFTGAKLVSINKDIEQTLSEDLGKAKQIIVQREKTVVIGGNSSVEEIEKRKEYYHNLAKGATLQEQHRTDSRIAALSGGIGIVKVGAVTDSELAKMLPKVRNAVSSVMLALKGGVTKGAGLGLKEINISSRTVNWALKLPATTILNNANTDITWNEDEPYNYVTREQGDFMEIGVMDATEVLVAALESAVSVACGLLSSKRMLVDVTSNKE